MSNFTGLIANDFHACNGTRMGAEYLQRRMECLKDRLAPAVAQYDPDLTPVVSPIYTASRFRPNRDRPRDHACLYVSLQLLPDVSRPNLFSSLPGSRAPEKAPLSAFWPRLSTAPSKDAPEATDLFRSAPTGTRSGICWALKTCSRGPTGRARCFGPCRRLWPNPTALILSA